MRLGPSMTHGGASLVLLLLIAGCSSPSEPAPAPSPSLPASPLAGLATWRPAGTARFSSADPTGGNRDYVVLAPGSEHVLLDDRTMGVIEHIWLTIDPGFEEPQGLRKFVLRMFFDGAETPCVESPIGDFFCLPHGVRRNTRSLPIVVSAEGRAMNCFFPMPFRRSARITIGNEGEHPVLLYYNVTVARPRALGDDVLLFHARYHQEWPPQKGRDYRVLEARGRGQLVGCALGVQQTTPGWFGEGDEKIFVDDAQAPLAGTGTEDYFLDAWDLREGESLYYGFPLSTGEQLGSLHALHRFHVEDPIPFERHLVLDLEHVGRVFDAAGKMTGNGERYDRFSSVAYWYQDHPHHDFGGAGAVGARVLAAVPSDPRFLAPGTIGATELMRSARASEGTIEILATDPEQPQLGDRLRFVPAGDGASLELRFAVARAAHDEVAAEVVLGPDGGLYAAEIDGREAVPLDLFQRDERTRRRARIAALDLAEGEHVLTLRSRGRSPFAAGASLELGALLVTEAPGR